MLSLAASFIAMLERRTQFHQSIMVEHVSRYDPGIASFLIRTTQTLVAAGASYSDASQKAPGTLPRLVTSQGSLLAFLDCFRLRGIMALVCIPLALLTKKFGVAGRGQAH